MPTLGERFRKGWNAFFNNRDPSREDLGPGYSYRPDRVMLMAGKEKSIINSIYNRISLDAASLTFQHVRLDENENFVEEIQSTLNECLKLDANIDQTGRAFIQDVVLSMIDEGCVAIVPTDTSTNPRDTSSYDILSLRAGKIVQWFPESVRVRLYNERTGIAQEIVLPKKIVAIVENPFYSVMNTPNSTMKRLGRKMALLDASDEQNGSGKLDMLIQLPYTLKTELRKNEAEKRRKDIEMQLKGSQYGIGYIDATEKVVQLNRSVDSQLPAQVEQLTKELFSQLGLTEEILNGTANEQTMLNYYTRTIEPITSAICDEMKRKFLSKTARTQGQSIVCIRDPFKLVPVNNIAEIADKFTRNEILSSNEVRSIIGFRPSNQPGANDLLNKNMPHEQITEEELSDEEYNKQLQDLDNIDSQLNDLERQVDE